MNELKVGQVVYKLQRACSRAKKFDLVDKIIEKVGRKYFYLEHEHSTTRYFIDTLRSDYKVGSGTQVYLSEQEFKNEEEIRDLNIIINSEFDYSSSRFTLEQLRRIYKITQEDE